MFFYWQKKPTMALRPFIKNYWHFKRDFKPSTSHVIYPDSYYELIWVKNGTLFIDGKKTPRLYFSGYNEQKITLTGEGKIEIFGVRFFAWGLVPFVSMALVTGKKFTSAGDVLGKKEQRLLLEVLSKGKGSFYNLMDDFLVSKIIEHRLLPRIDSLSEMYLRSKGSLKVREIAKHHNLSNRQLERFVRKSTGSTPRELSARIRFENVRKALVNSEHRTLSELASEYGYTDQSHLNKEFRRFTNLTPAQYKKEFNKENAHLKSEQGWKWD